MQLRTTNNFSIKQTSPLKSEPSPPQQVPHEKLAILVGPDLDLTHPLKTATKGSATASSIMKV